MFYDRNAVPLVPNGRFTADRHAYCEVDSALSAIIRSSLSNVPLSCDKSVFWTLNSPLNGRSTARMNMKTRPIAIDVPEIMTRLYRVLENADA